MPSFLTSGEEARLIPVGADTAKEVRAVSVLLATLASVPPFAQTMMKMIGQRLGVRAQINCFTEVGFTSNDRDPRARPDGLIVVDGGRGRSWLCLVEAKIGRAELNEEQLVKYLGVARSNGVPALLTISNQFVATPTHCPVKLPRSATKGVQTFHWSWMSVLTYAMLVLNEHDFERPEQRFILREMVRYFSHPSIGVSTFNRMNPGWKELVGKVQSGARLAKSAPEVQESVAAWHQETRDLGLLLSRKLHRSVRVHLSRAHADDQQARLRDDSEVLIGEHKLRSNFDVPDAAAPLLVVADLQRRCITVSMSLAAPRDKQRASSRINWVLRQLTKTEPADIFVRASWPGRAPATQAALADLRQNPALLESENRSSAPTSFELLLIRDIAGKFSGSQTFIELLEKAVPHFYEQVGEKLRAYVAPPPKLQRQQANGKDAPGAEDEAKDLTPTTTRPATADGAPNPSIASTADEHG